MRRQILRSELETGKGHPPKSDRRLFRERTPDGGTGGTDEGVWGCGGLACMSDLSDRGLPPGQKGKYAIGKPQRFWIWVFFIRFNFWEFKFW